MSEGNRLVPKLRFPEFCKAVGWSSKKLNDACEVNPVCSALPEEFVYVELESVEAGSLKTRSVVNRSEAPSRAQRLLQSGDVMYQIVRPYQRNNLHFKTSESIAYVASTGYAQLRAKDSSDFLYQSVHADEFVDHVIARCTGSSYPAINSSDLADVPLALPHPAEQQKIADCLSSLDELISTQARKVDAFKTHKTGLMQRLFPEEGGTQPRIRLPEFQGSRQWKQMRLGTIGRVIRGASPRPQGDPRYFGGPIPRLMVQDVTRDGKWVTPKIDSLTEEGAALSRPCSAGTLTIVCSGNVGVVSMLAVDACIHDGFLALVDLDESIAIQDFIFHSLSTLRQQFENGATHGGIFTNLTTSVISQFEIGCPSKLEQQRIAELLTAADDLINAAAQKLETFKTHKKGLMQQLFPAEEAGAA